MTTFWEWFNLAGSALTFLGWSVFLVVKAVQGVVNWFKGDAD